MVITPTRTLGVETIRFYPDYVLIKGELPISWLQPLIQLVADHLRVPKDDLIFFNLIPGVFCFQPQGFERPPIQAAEGL